MDIHDSMTPQQLRQRIDILENAIRRAKGALEEQRRGDALRILKVAVPDRQRRDDPPGNVGPIG